MTTHGPADPQASQHHQHPDKLPADYTIMTSDDDGQKRYSRAESEPDTPLPSSLHPGFALLSCPTKTADLPALLRPLPLNPLDSADLGSELAPAMPPSSPEPPLPNLTNDSNDDDFNSGTLNTAASLPQLNETSIQYFPVYSTTPMKLNHLQGLMSSLQNIMNDQSFAMGDLRAQVDEIQDALNRVSSMHDGMTPEERRILQSAQMMKNLAEEVITSKGATLGHKYDLDSPASPHAEPRSTPLTISLPSLATRAMDSMQTPPPTALLSPTSLDYQHGHRRHRSSTTSFSSSANSDRQYTQDSEERSSRPSSAASSYRRHQRKKSLRQLEPLSNSNRGSQQDVESNAAFDRIRSLLTELITDASTALNTAPDGSQQPTTTVQFEPLVESDTESSVASSADSSSDHEDEGADEINSVGEDNNNIEAASAETTSAFEASATKSAEVVDPFLKRLQVTETASTMDDGGVEVELEPTVHHRADFRSRLDRPNKRLSSLFMELQNTQTIQDASPKENQTGRRRQMSDAAALESEWLENKDNMPRQPRRSISSMSLPTSRSSRPNSMYFTTSATMGLKAAVSGVENADVVDSSESAPESPLLSGRIGRKPRQRGSISSMRSEPVTALRQSFFQDIQRQQRINTVELDRTVETIDGLTRDLVAVATHQNWMQMRLQKTLQFQKEQVRRIERAHSGNNIAAVADEDATSAASVHEHHRAGAGATTSGAAQADSLASQIHPLADLSNSLKQVAVSVGRVLKSSAKHSRSRQGQSSGEGKSTSSSSSNVSSSRRTFSGRFAGKDFSRYFQELEKIAALGGKIGFGRSSDVEDGAYEELIGKALSSTPGSRRASASGSGTTAAEPQQHHYHHQQGDFSDIESGRDDASSSVLHSRGDNVSTSSSSLDGPPDLEDFAAQCRLLTRALVLPFVQLTHHAMTSQDSALALAPRSGSNYTSDPVQDLHSTLEFVENMEGSIHSGDMSFRAFSPSASNTRRSSMSTNAGSSYAFPSRHSHRESPGSYPYAAHRKTSPLSVAGRELDSMLRGSGEVSPDAIVKARAFMSTGLYLLHLLYWTVLFVVGTVILDPWLAETAGQQVVRVVDQVRDVVAKDGAHQTGDGRARIEEASSSASLRRQSVDSFVSMDQHHGSVGKQHRPQQQQEPLGEEPEEEEEVTTAKQGKVQALEDRAIEVAVGFESLKHRLNSVVGSGRRGWTSGLWSRQVNSDATTAASAAVVQKLPVVPQTVVQGPSQQHAWATGAGAGPVPRQTLDVARRKSL
ncbi:hypothetical protein BGZ98_002428 [Dissophora globulifera]|nr:hypothetical protein BGZ98_002428 [Dissophora globulifera]